MHQFLNENGAAYGELQRQAQSVCVEFPDQEMPAGASPTRARIGFEIDDSGFATLYVERGIQYSGTNEEVREWFERGGKWFTDFDQLRRWIQGPLARAYRTGRANPSSLPQRPSARLQSSLRPEALTDMQAVRQGLEEQTPALFLDAAQLFEDLCETVRGQDRVLRTLAESLCSHVARKDPRRPARIFMIGPTGVGKTKAAESIAPAIRSQVGSAGGYVFLRLDMSEYQERHRISQLLGSPQGFVGYYDGAQLPDALRANDKTIVLFDEIEKAHPDILKTLMNTMDAGRLSTARGNGRSREIDCRRAIFIFTSNLDATGILSDLEAQEGGFEDLTIVDAVCRRRLEASGIKPELVGRIGTFLVFRPLSMDTQAEIISLSIPRVAKEFGVAVSYIAPSVILSILSEGKSAGFGARPYEYLVEYLLGRQFAEMAATGQNVPIEVHGDAPPYQCIPASTFKQPILRR